jgi:hypothetical protein
MAACRPDVASAFARRGFALPAGGDAAAVAAKLAALAGDAGADGLAREFEAYTMAA